VYEISLDVEVSNFKMLGICNVCHRPVIKIAIACDEMTTLIVYYLSTNTWIDNNITIIKALILTYKR